MGITVEPAAVAGGLVPSPAVSAHGGTLGIVTLISWLFTASIGGYMFSTLAARGGLRRQRAVRDGLPPAVLFGHLGLALTGLMAWVSYLATGWAALAWSAVGLLMPAFGLGICTVTLWTPYPSPSVAAGTGPPGGGCGGGCGGGGGAGGGGAAGGMLANPAEEVRTGRVTDEVLARALTDDVLASKLIDEVLASVPADASRPARKPRVYPAALIPFGHGLAAMATFVLAVVTAAGTR